MSSNILSYLEIYEAAKSKAHAEMVEGNLSQAARVLFDAHEEIVKKLRAAKETDGPSLTKSSEEFKASEETVQTVSETMNQVRELVFSAITENPASAVLFYEQLGNYAKGTVKSYRDFVLITGATGDEDETETVQVVDVDAETIKEIRSRVESFDALHDSESLLPVKEKTGTIAFSSIARLFDSSDAATVDVSDGVQTFDTLFYVDGEMVPTQILSEVALYHLSSADNPVSTKDIRDHVAKSREDGKAILSENYTVTVNGHTLEMVRNES